MRLLALGTKINQIFKFMLVVSLQLNEFYEEFAIWFDQTPKSEKLKFIDVISRY